MFAMFCLIEKQYVTMRGRFLVLFKVNSERQDKSHIHQSITKLVKAVAEVNDLTQCNKDSKQKDLAWLYDSTVFNNRAEPMNIQNSTLWMFGQVVDCGVCQQGGDIKLYRQDTMQIST